MDFIPDTEYAVKLQAGCGGTDSIGVATHFHDVWPGKSLHDYAQSSSGTPFVVKNAPLDHLETAEPAGERYRTPDLTPVLRGKVAVSSDMSFVRNQASLGTQKGRVRERQYSQPENDAELVIWYLRGYRGARLVLLKVDKQGKFRPKWNRWQRARPGSGHCIDHLRKGGTFGWQPCSFECVVVDVDENDPMILVNAFPPLAYLPTEHGGHVVYRKSDISIVDNTNFSWRGLRGQLKSTGMCRFHGNGLERLASALHVSGGEGPTLPLELLGTARKENGTRPAKQHEGPKLTTIPKYKDVKVGNRNVSLFHIGRHIMYRFRYEGYEDLLRQCTELAFDIAESFPCTPEPDEKIHATARSWARYKWEGDTRTGAPLAGKSTEARTNRSRRNAPDNRAKSQGSSLPGDNSQGGMKKARGTPSVVQKQRSRGGKVRAERARAANVLRDWEIWQLHDSGLSVRKIKDRLDKKTVEEPHQRVQEYSTSSNPI